MPIPACIPSLRFLWFKSQMGLRLCCVNMNMSFVTEQLLTLMNTPSPTGYTHAGMQVLTKTLEDLGVQVQRTKKGALMWTLPGKPGGKTVTFAAHIDTLGAMVKTIKSNGRLGITNLGDFDWATIEGEYCTVHTRSGKKLTGTVVNTHGSYHIYGGAALREVQRNKNTIEIRLDSRSRSRSETEDLGVKVGDFISWEARPVLTEEGYIKGRHLDNKAAVAVFLGLTREVLEEQIELEHTAHFFISNYEEVEHGAASGIPAGTDELIVVDMAVVGEGQTSDEHHCSICVKDYYGPYDDDLSNRILQVAEQLDMALNVDVYTFYGSDASSAWRSGGDYPAALIGPGVEGSHAYERTHLEALEATGKLMLGYLQTP